MPQYGGNFFAFQTAIAAGFGISPKPDFWIERGDSSSSYVHIAFAATSQEQVDQFYEAAIAAGGIDNGKPGPRSEYHAGYYGKTWNRSH